jgi:outer membrane protein assembly factor BamB
MTDLFSRRSLVPIPKERTQISESSKGFRKPQIKPDFPISRKDKTMKFKNLWHGAVAVFALFCIFGTMTHVAESEPIATEWHQWRGPNRDGISDETGILKGWSEAAPKELWRISLGNGFSGISVANGRAYTMFAKGEDEVVVCLDAKTGKELWRHLDDWMYEERQGGNGPRTTPTVDGDRVYVLSAFGRLVALDANTGVQLWDKDLTKTFSSQMPQWGFSTSPIVFGDRLLVEVGGTDGNGIVAFDKATGSRVWGTDAVPSGYSSPVLVTINDVQQVLFFVRDELLSLEPTDGKIYWRYPWAGGRNSDNRVTPVFIAPDKIFISSQNGSSGVVIQITGEAPDMHVKEVWRERTMINRISTSVLHDGYLYGFSNTIFTCIDALTGEEQWKTRGFGQGTVIYADGHLIVLGDSGNLALVKATPKEYIEVAQRQVLSGRCWTVPTLSGGRLYLRNHDELVCLEVAERQ